MEYVNIPVPNHQLQGLHCIMPKTEFVSVVVFFQMAQG